MRGLMWVAVFTTASSVWAAEAEAQVDVDHRALSQRLLGREVTAGAGVLGQGFTFEGGQWGDLFTTQHVAARWRFGGFTLEGDVTNAVPLRAEGGALSLTLLGRAGWTGERFSLTLGPTLQVAPAAAPAVQWVPSARGVYVFDHFAVTIGLFDLHALAIARVSVDVGRFGGGFVAPLGAEVHGRFALGDVFAVQVQALAFRAWNAQYGFLSVSGVYGAGAPGGES